MTLTPREAETLGFISAHLKAHGIPPATHEICIALRLSPSSRALVARYIDALVAKGHLRRLARRARGIELVQTEHNHAHDCCCSRCAEARYQRDLQLVHALQVEPPVALTEKLAGLRPLGHLARLDWRYTDNSRVRRKPLLSLSKVSQNPSHQILRGAV